MSHNNRKLGIEIKSMKDDNQFLLARIQNISKDWSILEDEINQEKKAQADMIKIFEEGKQNKAQVNELSKDKNSLTE